MKKDMSHVRTAVYLIEADDSKQINPQLVGGRRIITNLNSTVPNDYQIVFDSINDTVEYDLCDGHINRNIRAILSMIDLSKP